MLPGIPPIRVAGSDLEEVMGEIRPGARIRARWYRSIGATALLLTMMAMIAPAPAWSASLPKLPAIVALPTTTAAPVAAADTTAPGPVTGLSLTPGTTTVKLAWTNPTASDFAGVMIRRAAGATPPASVTAGTLVANVTKPAVSYTNTGLAAATKYSYAVFAYDAVPNYATKTAATTTTLVADTTAPGPVTGLSLTPGTTTVKLAWTNPTASDFAGVMIRRAAGATPPASVTAGTLVANVTKPAVSYTNTGLAAATKYSYAVFAYDAVPNYATKTAATTTTLVADTTAPGPVTGLSLTPGTTTVKLAWTNPTASDFAGS
jgi:hypothetical protein